MRKKNKKFPPKVHRPKWPSYLVFTETPQNAWNDPKHPEILSEVEWEVTSYRFAYRYEIFRPFRLERNGINNFGISTYIILYRSRAFNAFHLIISPATLIWNFCFFKVLQWFVNHLNCCYAVSPLPFVITENWYTPHYYKGLLRYH